MTARLLVVGLTLLALPSPAPAGAQSPLSNKKFVQGLIATNASNVASVLYTGTSPLATRVSPVVKDRPLARYVVSINYGLGARRVDVLRPTPPNRVITTAIDGYAWTTSDGGAPVASAGGVVLHEREIAMSPHGVFKYAQAPGARAVVADAAGPDNKTRTTVTFTAAGSRIKATLNEAGFVVRAETLAGDAVTGNAPVVLVYGDYRDVDGIMFPFRITETRGDETVVDLTLTEIRPNAGFYVEPPASIRRK